MPYPIKSDITIIGAGPAGVIAAMKLSKMGIPCLLIDKYEFPKEKICGDGLGGAVVSILNKIDPAYVTELQNSGFATGSHAVRFYSPDLKMMELSFIPGEQPVPQGFICKRIDFDNFLLNKALMIPEIHFVSGTRISKLSRDENLILLEDDTGRKVAETRLVLFACGADRSLISQLDPAYPDHAGEGVGVRGYFDHVTGSDQQYAIEIHFLEELLPCYLWIFPFADGSANVGLALTEPLAEKNERSLKELLFYLLEKYPHLKKRFENAKLNGKIAANRLPFYTGPFPIAGDNYLLLGDAGRLIDPFIGEGISKAMASGYLAAEIAAGCLERNDFSASSTQIYQQKVYEKLGPELATGLRLQSLARRKYLLNLVIGRASRNEKTRDMIAEMLYNPKAKEKLKKPLFYLKLILGW